MLQDGKILPVLGQLHGALHCVAFWGVSLMGNEVTGCQR